MSRGLTSGMQTAIAAGRVYPVIFVQAQFLTGTVYLWSGQGTLSWNGQTWLGVGKLGKISPISETTDVQATNISVSLSGIPSDLLSQVLTEVRNGFPVYVWFGAMDDAANLIADPYQSFSGRMDVPTIDEGAETSAVTITVENVLVDLQRRRAVMYTDTAQQAEFPGDRGFEYVPQLQNLSINWGVPSAPVTKVTGTGSSSVPGRTLPPAEAT